MPKEMKLNLEARRHLLKRAEANPRVRAALMEVCRRDPVFFFDAFLYTFDPRGDGKIIPFITYGYQERVIRELESAIDDETPYGISKVRDMGGSYMCIGTFLKKVVTEKYRKFLMLSRTGDLVERSGDPDCLFWKLDDMADRLPDWMLPGYDSRIMVREYPSTRGVVTGGTNTEAAGVGGRATAVLVDELSRYDPMVAKSIMSGVADVSRCRVFNFTPNPRMGKDHPAYGVVEMVRAGKIRGCELHWTLHPEKRIGHYTVDKVTREITIIDTDYKFPRGYVFQDDGEFFNHSIWFDAERIARGSDEAVREMMELDWEGGGISVIPMNLLISYATEVCRPPLIEGDLIYDHDTGEPKRFDVFPHGPIKLWSPLFNGKLVDAPYCCGNDISLGTGSTNSCCSCANMMTRSKILELATCSMKPEEFATKVVAICRWLSSKRNECLLCWEKSGPGETFGNTVSDLNYRRLWYAKSKGSIAAYAGWNPHKKEEILEEYRSSLSGRDFINPSRVAIEEAVDFVYSPKGGVEHKASFNRALDPSGAAQNHGDRAIADAQCNMMCKEYGAQAAKNHSVQDPHDIRYIFEDDVQESGMYQGLQRELYS